MGSTYSGTAGSWTTTNYASTTGATSVVGTNGATFYITGVQLEIGTSATPFERRLYDKELISCQRYYVRFTAGSAYNLYGTGYAFNTTLVRSSLPLPVTMRAVPTTYEFSTASGFLLENNGSSTLTPSALATSTNSSTTYAQLNLTVSGATAGAGYTLYSSNNTTSYIGIGAEL
jgi:hypothetical protein